MKQSLVLTIVALAGCMHGPTCTFPNDDSSAKISAECLKGTLIGADGDSLLSFGTANPPGPDNLEVDRLDIQRGTRTTLTNNIFVYSRPIVANGEVYFLTCAQDPMIPPCAIQAIPTAGGPPRTVVSLDPAELLLPYGAINGFVVDASSIYWVDSSFWSAPLAGGAPTRLADAHSSPGGAPGVGTVYDERILAVDDTGLYAAAGPTCSTAFEKIALDGSSRIPIANDVIGRVVARDGVVYWMEPSAVPENGSCAQNGGGGSGGGCGGPEYGSLRSWSADAGVQIIQDQIDGRGDVVVDKSIAWTVGAVGPLCQGPLVNSIMQLVDGIPTTIATAGNEGLLASMVTDRARLYANDGSSILRVPFR